MTFELRHYVLLANHRGATSVRRHSLTSFGISLEDFLSSKVIHAGQLCGLEEIVDFVCFLCVAGGVRGKIVGVRDITGISVYCNISCGDIISRYQH